MGDRTALVLLAGIGLALIVAFVALHPRADPTTAGRGSDRDEAIDQAVEAVLDGHYPYEEVTYLNGPITSMPSLLLMSSPWVVLFGTSALQNIAWAPAGLGLSARWFGDHRRALIAAGLVSALCVGFWQEHITGGDLTSSTLCMTMAALWAYSRIQRNPTRQSLVVVGVVLGLAISTRANFVLVLLPVLAAAWAVGGPRMAGLIAVASVTTAAAITLPFLLVDPTGFTPLTAMKKVTGIEDVLPGARFLVPGIGVALAIVLSIRLAWRGPLGFLVACAVPQAAMVAPVVAVLAIAGRPSSFYSVYGLAFTWFAVIAGVGALYGRGEGRRPSPSS